MKTGAKSSREFRSDGEIDPVLRVLRNKQVKIANRT